MKVSRVSASKRGQHCLIKSFPLQYPIFSTTVDKASEERLIPLTPLVERQKREKEKRPWCSNSGPGIRNLPYIRRTRSSGRQCARAGQLALESSGPSAGLAARSRPLPAPQLLPPPSFCAGGGAGGRRRWQMRSLRLRPPGLVVTQSSRRSFARKSQPKSFSRMTR